MSHAPRDAETIIAEAMKRSPTDRLEFVLQACGTDEALRHRVEAMLQRTLEIGNNQETAAPARTGLLAEEPEPAVAWTVSKVAPPVGQQPPGDTYGAVFREAPASRLGSFSAGEPIAGRYTLLGILGEGGMGTVYLASQSDPVKRQVALKLIKVGMDSRVVLARLDAERQALALMDHPNIARFFDGGTTANGQPFFVMELVSQAKPITIYCDEKRLSVKARLELFIGVCLAVQHAHQKGIIHRDLKPSNVLITEIDGAPAPKIIDFGVAKATEIKLTDQSFGDTGSIVGTPMYMSPEQADPSFIDIDTRTDIYALGVILYELLVGSPPIDASQFKRGAVLEMLRMVREVDPPKPSTKLSASDARPNIAANRSLDPAELHQKLRGDLDWIVMKALEKDRARRYETATGFAADLMRHLAFEPVLAAPPSRAYRLRKFARKNRGAVIATGLVLLALLVGIVGTTWGLFQARQSAAAERVATIHALQSANAEKAANAQAQKRLLQIEKANVVLGSIFENLDPDEIAKHERPLQAILVEKLDKAVEQLEGDAVGDPLIVAAMQARFARSLLGLGEADKAIVLCKKVRGTYEALLGPHHPDTLKSTTHLGEALWANGLSDKAFQLFSETLALQKAALGPDHPDTLETMNDLAVLYQAVGKFDQALPLLEETLKAYKSTLGLEHSDTHTIMNNVGEAYLFTGDLDRAMPLLKEALARRKSKLGADHPQTLISKRHLAAAYHRAIKYAEAAELYEETLKGQRARLGSTHPETLMTLSGLAEVYRAQGSLSKAILLSEEATDRLTTKLGDDHPDTLRNAILLALTYCDAKQFDKSIPLLEATVRRYEKTLGRQHPTTLVAIGNLGYNYMRAGRLAEAIPLLEEAHLAADKSPTLSGFGAWMIEACTAAGRTDKAALLIAEQRKSLPKESPQLATQLVAICRLLFKGKLFVEAEPLLRESLAIREQKEPGHWTTFNTQSALGGALLGQQKYAEAEPLLLKGYEGMKQQAKSIPAAATARVHEALDRLIELYTITNKPEEVKKWQAERTQWPAIQP